MSVSESGIGVTQPNLHFSDIYRHKSPILTLYQLIRVAHTILGLVFIIIIIIIMITMKSYDVQTQGE